VNKTWRFLDFESEDPYVNMAIEEAIARKVGEGETPNTLRLWRNKNAVVIGNFQSLKQEVNMQECARLGVCLVRRFTGGGAVYHDLGNLNYSMSIVKDDPLVVRDPIQVYSYLSRFVVEAIRLIGVNSEFKPPSEISVNGLKISGSACSMKWGTVFLHGSILVDTDLEALSRVLCATDICEDHPYVRSVKRDVTCLKRELGRDVTMVEVKNALEHEMQETYGLTLVRRRMTRSEMQLTKKLFLEKYSTTEWNARY